MEIILVDGSNVARAGGGRQASYQDLEALEAALVAQGYAPRTIVDASLRHRLSPEDSELLDERLFDGTVLQVPKGTSADAWLVEEAERLGCLIVSNDRMRDWQPSRPWLSARLVPFDLPASVRLPH